MAREHGTISGYQGHLRDAEDACEPCLTAWREYQAEYRATHPNSRAAEKRRSAARARALWRLRLVYPTEFARLYSEELAKGVRG